MTAAIPASQITLGVLAGGLATRLGGRDKAWIERDGTAQVLRWQRRFAPEVAGMIVSANRDLPRYARHGLHAVADRLPGAAPAAGAGPVAGLDALAHACPTPWMLTLPVDLFGVNDCLLPTLVAGSAADGAWARDEEGGQPLVALWRVEAMRQALASMPEASGAVHALQARLDMACVTFRGVRFGNLNTPEDLLAAGISHE
ncbi:molybdenum cofactor guanylyltransferase [Agrilutibacter solisilvae]|uniref:NTP transferase domain-containing protein n=1 Tax=Agrilutibacter solisilvae TaxID=2763317 RepID=A0A975ARJ4_9GAMM|nr:NTP transferase domain-containing protein [Lysobacter solisilvae]QSX77722.1 NTP transferase domain-containing protein [Lysobacter solisilvae]